MLKHVRIISCERDGKWASWLRDGLTSEVAIRQCRSLAECQSELAQDAHAFVLVEATDQNADLVAEFLQTVTRCYARPRFAVVGDRTLRDYQWVWRAAGAVHVAFGYDQTMQAARMAERYIASVEPPEIDFRQEIFDRIPW